ncbi:MAG TPA: hypothetical protein VHP80_12575 [Candidatus Acidoferrum sp.]|jgi:hypothetical protein|nr:hypothetical protein [Candidatus Acidoferrum sp.]
MTGPAVQQAHEFRKPTEAEWKHFIENHIGVLISKDGATTVSVIGECDKPKCPTHVVCCKYCKRPPC